MRDAVQHPGRQAVRAGFVFLQLLMRYAEHLAGLGHRRIAHIYGPLKYNFSAERLKGYRRALADAGVEAGVLMAPIVPGLTSQPAKIERTIKAIADHGARFCGAIVMHLEGGTRDHFMRFLSREFPGLAPRVDRLYTGKCASRQYRDQVHGVLELLRRRYGLAGGRETVSATAGRTARIPVPPEEGQGCFRWRR